MSEQQDDGTRIGLWVTFSVVAVLVVSVLAGVVTRHLSPRAPASVPAEVTMLASGPAGAEIAAFLDAPLEGELVATVFFAVGQAALPEDSRSAIEAAIAAAAAAPARRVVLSGFHDASGAAAVNAQLARDRAMTIREALSAEGLSLTRIALRKPDVTLGDGAAPEARRVEIRLVD